jgi:Nucleotidyl transferase AbiEii toxin, Type IV TA system
VTYDSADVLAAQEHFGFARPAPIEKDWYVLRAMRAIVSVDAAPFRFVLAGGTCLARAYKLIRRMSEDVDFKVAPFDGNPVSNNKRRSELGGLRDRATASLQAAGFSLDPSDSAQLRSRDGNRYTVYQLPYAVPDGTPDSLRPTIQIELNYAALRRPFVSLPVASFVAEAFGRPAEIATIACVSIAETAAEKLISLTRRTAMEVAGLARAPDPALVRHIYDLHITRNHYDAAQVVELAREIMPLDADEFRSQFPAYRKNPTAETRRALFALKTDSHYAERYAQFLQLMVYGDKPRYEDALATVASMARRL